MTNKKVIFKKGEQYSAHTVEYWMYQQSYWQDFFIFAMNFNDTEYWEPKQSFTVEVTTKIIEDDTEGKS